VIPDASALRSEGRLPLSVQQSIYMGDSIQTGPSGEAQIDFVDSTRLVVGPSSSLLIDNSVLRNKKTMSSFVVSALRGTFRFISGTSPKPAYAIRTPTATIGVRGTEFDFAVLPDGGTEFVLFHGSAQVCDRSGNCTIVTGACSAISVPRSGPIRALLDREDRNARLRANFPYIRARNASLRPEFRTDVRTCGNIAAAAADPDSKDAGVQSAAAAAPSPAPDPPSRGPAPSPSRPDPAPPAAPASPAPAAPSQPPQNGFSAAVPGQPADTASKGDYGGKGDHGGKGEHGGKGDHGGKGGRGGRDNSGSQGRAGEPGGSSGGGFQGDGGRGGHHGGGGYSHDGGRQGDWSGNAGRDGDTQTEERGSNR
jgi:hypothetical protein